MKLKKFRIHNYKSIIDSGDCYPSETVTILAGKNESGKSSLLEALRDANADVEISSRAIPIERQDEIPKISLWFEVSKSDIDDILDELDISIEVPLAESTEIQLIKTYPSSFTIAGDQIAPWKLDEPLSYNDEVSSIYDEIATAEVKSIASGLGQAIPKLVLSDFVATRASFEQFKKFLSAQPPQWPEGVRAPLVLNVDRMISSLNDAIKAEPVLAKFTAEFLKYMPNFILFSSFDDVFPNEIPLPELAKNGWIQDLQQMSNIEVETILAKDDRAKVQHKKKLNTTINEDFKQFWDQDLSNLAIDWDNEKLSFWIEENGYYYEPEIRSQGRRWHLAFYVRVSARAQEEVRNVILIDEPGLYLHADAQRAILKNLEAASVQTPVIFSTHSPYLIEPDKLDRLRLVIKTVEGGTIVENKLHKVSDKETLTPILTAIGLELNQGIVNVARENNVIVEGPSDYFYLSGLKRILKFENLNFISGGSSGNMPKVGTILQGWGCKVIYLYDNDKAYKDALKNIKKDWLAITKEILAVLPIDGAIEDIFSAQDFATHVLDEISPDPSVKNSDRMKGRDKVMPARHFSERALADGIIKLDAVTIGNATSLFKLLADKFSGAL
jgi:predicted ATP-dependent endonuclease of OLD family